ncbi:acyl carrier protein, partial [Streptomyces mayteni]
HQHGLPAHSLAWGLWETTSGMTGHLTTTDHQRLAQHHLAPLTDTQGLTLLDTTLTTTHPHTITAHFTQPPRAAGLPANGAVPVGVGSPGGRNGVDQVVGSGDRSGLAAQLAKATGSERRRMLMDLVLGTVSVVLKHDSAAGLDPDQGFLDLGFDSLTAVELRNNLNAATGLRLPTTTIFDHPTSARLAAYLDAELPAVAGARPGHGAADDPFAVLDRLEAALAGVPPHGQRDRSELAVRLASLLARLEASGESGPGHGAGDEDAFAGLSSASDEEIFSLIDGDLGLPDT